MASIEDIRQLSYKYFPIKKPLRFEIETDNRTAYIEGYVETNEPNIFSESEETDITIICPNPYFISTSTEETVFFGMAPRFEFLTDRNGKAIPEELGSKYYCLDNPVVFDDDGNIVKAIEIGSIEVKTYNAVPYSGDAEVGIIITMHAIGTVKNVDIYNTITRDHMRIDTDKLTTKTGHPIINKDDIIINTIDGQKSVTLIRDGEEINILNCVNKDADFFKLAKGNNTIAFTAEEGGANLQFKMSHSVLYEGI